MNMPLNLRALLKHAEACKEAAAWEALARNLMAEQRVTPRRAKAPRGKPAPAPAIDPATLTLMECRALGIKPPRDRFGSGAYVFVLVEFKNGQRILTGQYPRAKDPKDRGAAIGGARAKLLLAVSGGIYMEARAKIPAVRTVRDITDPAELEAVREECYRQRAAFETFLHAPYWDGDSPRDIPWVKRQHLAEPSPKLEKVLRDHGSKPLWWRVTYRGEQAR